VERVSEEERAIKGEMEAGGVGGGQQVKRRHERRRGQYNRVIFSAPASARVGTRKTFLVSASVSSLCRRETLEYSEHGGNNNSRVFSPTVCRSGVTLASGD